MLIGPAVAALGPAVAVRIVAVRGHSSQPALRGRGGHIAGSGAAAFALCAPVAALALEAAEAGLLGAGSGWSHRLGLVRRLSALSHGPGGSLPDTLRHTCHSPSGASAAAASASRTRPRRPSALPVVLPTRL